MKQDTLRSMTGFGRGASTSGAVTYQIDVRTLNHRFLDVTIRSARSLGPLELKVRNLTASRLKRGKVDITISRRNAEGEMSGAGLPFQRPVFDSYMKIYRDLLSEFASGMRPEAFERHVGEILSKPGVFDLGADLGAVDERDGECLLAALDSALDDLNRSRSEEGASIDTEIRQRLTELTDFADRIESAAPSLAQDVQARFEDRLKKLFPNASFDETRVVQEAGFLAERVDIAEELQRFKQHLKVFVEALSGEAPGKRLDFLIQELGRECNTVASKSQNASINYLVVEAKVVLEKIKEQIQNIE